MCETLMTIAVAKGPGHALMLTAPGPPGQSAGDKTYALGANTKVMTRPGHTVHLSQLRIGDHVGVPSRDSPS